MNLLEIAKTASIVRTVGNIGSLLIFGLAYMDTCKNTICSPGANSDLGFGKIIWIYLTSILISGLLGAPWDAFLLWAHSLPSSSSLFDELWFQISVFGSLGLNSIFVLAGEIGILIFIIQYVKESWGALTPLPGEQVPAMTLGNLVR